MKRSLIYKFFPLFFFISLLAACLPETKKVTVRREPVNISVPIVSDMEIDEDVSKLTTLMKRDNIDEKGLKIAEKLISDYDTIKSLNNDSDSNMREIIELLLQNLSFITEEYFLKETIPKDKPHSHVIEEYSKKRKTILNRYLSRDYQGVIADCAELELQFGPEALTPEIGLVFAESLAQENMIDEAINIGERIIRELEGRPDIIDLKASIIEWHLQLGNKDVAAHLKEKLSDNIYERENIYEIVKNRLDNPDIIINSDEDVIDKNPEEEIYIRELETTDQVLTEVNRLMLEKRFNEAKSIISKQLMKPLSDSDLKILEQALRTIKITEEKHIEELSEKRSKLNELRRLVETEKYKEAISEIENMEKLDENDQETDKLKADAIERLINNEGNRAAEIFLMAKRASDPERKKALLKASYKILNDLINQYPSSPFITKLNNYLSSVVKELEKIGG